MSHAILAAQRCADASCNRIEVAPSRLAASAWLAWLVLACAVTWFAVALPWLARFSICVIVAAAGVHGLRTFVLLRGPLAVRAIEWTEAGDWSVCLGATSACHPAKLANGSFRLGLRFWILRFETPAGPSSVLVEEAGATHAFRRLSRHLNDGLRRASGHSRHPAVTIQPKV
jgi:hypothetical protein